MTAISRGLNWSLPNTDYFSVLTFCLFTQKNVFFNILLYNYAVTCSIHNVSCCVAHNYEHVSVKINTYCIVMYCIVLYCIALHCIDALVEIINHIHHGDIAIILYNYVYKVR